MAKDKLFLNNSVDEDFRFTSKVAEVFDDMLERSVPCYAQVIDMSARMLAAFLENGDHVCDLGCSTGTTLIELARRLSGFDNLKFTGVDNSLPMIEKAAIKAEMYSKKDLIEFIEQDISAIQLKDCGAIIMNYTLQFVRPMERQNFLNRVFTFLRPGGILILSEKVISHDPLLNRKFIDLYHDFKKEKGYSEIEISRKREALENVLIPFSAEENLTMLGKAGFASVETFFTWFNFISFCAVKS